MFTYIIRFISVYLNVYYNLLVVEDPYIGTSINCKTLLGSPMKNVTVVR